MLSHGSRHAGAPITEAARASLASSSSTSAGEGGVKGGAAPRGAGRSGRQHRSQVCAHSAAQPLSCSGGTEQSTPCQPPPHAHAPCLGFGFGFGFWFGFGFRVKVSYPYPYP